MTRISTSLLFLFFLFLLPASTTFASSLDETAQQILDRALESRFGKGFYVEMDLETVGKTVGKSSMKIGVLGKISRNVGNLLIFFQEPADSRGMKLLVKSKRGMAPLLFLYMPETGQPLQLAQEDLNMPLGESAATLGDLISIIPWDGTHTLLGTEQCGEEPCYKIETHLDTKKGRRLTLVGKKSLLSYSVELYDIRAKMVKKIETLETEKFGDKHYATSMKITNYLDNSSTTILKLVSGNMDLKIDDSAFKPSRMKYSYSELLHLGEDVL